MTSSQAGQRVFDGTNTSPRSKKSAREAPTSVVCCSASVAGFVNIQPSRPQTCCLNAHVTDRTMTRMQLKFENDYITFALTHLFCVNDVTSYNDDVCRGTHHVRNPSRLFPQIFHTASDKNLGIERLGTRLVFGIVVENCISSSLIGVHVHSMATVWALNPSFL